MKKFTLTTTLNIKIVCIISVFMIIIITHNQWRVLQERENEYAVQLEAITEFIATKMPGEKFAAIVETQAASSNTKEEQVLLINQETQPVLENIMLASKLVKYGFYAKDQQRIVAIGPDFDHSLLIAMDPRFLSVYSIDSEYLGKKSNSMVWYGASILYHVRPLKANGQTIGHVFACLNLDAARAEFWNSTLKTLAGGLFALIIVIMLFQEVFIRFKKELESFAEAILNGQGKRFESKIPELTPILQYISEQTETMTRLDRLNIVGEMAASIGHEVRNPMTTVRGFLQFLGNKPEFCASREHFSLMISEMDRANIIITEFLALAKDKAMDFKAGDLNQVITDIVPLLQSDALRCNCQLELHLAAIPPVIIDKNSIRQLILNMVRNAIEAMEQGGEIKISTLHQDRKVLLSIQDKGSGIPEKILKKLGTPFITTKENGIGIGLAVCYRIVQRHGGEIDVDSQLGRGTTFTISFNAAAGEGINND